MPAFRSTHLAIAPVLKQSAGSLLGGSLQIARRAAAAGNTLVVAQVALSVLVLVFAGLFLRTLGKLRALIRVSTLQTS